MLLTLLNSGCGRGGNPSAASAPPPVAVVVETAERADVPIIVELVAHTESIATVEIRANVEGRLTGMSFQEGRMVHAGQQLFRIDPRRYEAAEQSGAAAVEKAEADLEMAREQQHLTNAQSALRQAEAALLKANQDVDRLKPLAERRAVPQRDLDAAIAAQSSAAAAVEDARATIRTTEVGDRMGLRQAQASLVAAKAALEKAKLDVEETVITAPIGGLIGRMEVAVRQLRRARGAGPAGYHFAVDPMLVVFSIPETLYLRTAALGVDHAALDRIELILADNSVYPVRGRFANVGRTVDPKTATLLVEAQFPNPKGILLPGMFGRVRMAAETKKNAVLVAERALFDVQGSKAVYVVTADQKVALRSVVVEGAYEGRSIITRGLDGGESVIVEGILKARPGQVVSTQVAKAGR
jgi:membrane fusion protein, multidrug efflux system